MFDIPVDTTIKNDFSKTVFIKNIVKNNILAGIIKIPKKEDFNQTYNELPRTLEDEKKIHDLITSLGIHGKLTLLLHHEKRLRKIGDEVRYLHPYKFLGYIFKNEDLKPHMLNIFDDYFKRTNFLKDFSQTMDIYDLKNKLLIYLDDFAQEINVPSEELRPFIIEKDWSNFLRYITFYK